MASLGEYASLLRLLRMRRFAISFFTTGTQVASISPARTGIGLLTRARRFSWIAFCISSRWRRAIFSPMASEVRSTFPGPDRKEPAEHLSLHAARAGRKRRILTWRSRNQKVGMMLVHGHRTSYRAICVRLPVC